MSKSLIALMIATAAAATGCATRIGLPGPNDLEITIPAVTIESRPEYQGRTHLRRHWVERGTRYCEYTDGKVYQRHYRYDCPYTY
jgi:hypothetical protein